MKLLRVEEEFDRFRIAKSFGLTYYKSLCDSFSTCPIKREEEGEEEAIKKHVILIYIIYIYHFKS